MDMRKVILLLVVLIAACSQDPNETAIYGDTGLAVNCRAYVQVSIDSWRNEEYPTQEIMNALERNCGENGWLWGNEE
jgi:hypothetical protein